VDQTLVFVQGEGQAILDGKLKPTRPTKSSIELRRRRAGGAGARLNGPADPSGLIA